jgi:hypothetical protein
METTVTTIAAWLSLNLGLPAIDAQPRIEFVSPQAMEAKRQQEATRARPDHPLFAGGSRQARTGSRIEAFYDDAERTIYLAEGWTGKSPAEFSVLVHEMVHHVQNVAGLKYACPGEREAPAYEAQAKWLALFGRNLGSEFKLDPMTLFARTRCLG